MHAHDLDIAIARAEGRLEALRELRGLLPASAPPRAEVTTGEGRTRQSVPAAEVNGHAKHILLDLDDLEPEAEPAPAGPPPKKRLKAARQAKRQPPGPKSSLAPERRRKVAKHIAAHGPTKCFDLAGVAGCPHGSINSVLDHPWFVRDERGLYNITPTCRNEFFDE